MTVKDLIARLEAYPPEFEVHGVLGVGQHTELVVEDGTAREVIGVKVHMEAATPKAPKAPEPIVPPVAEKVTPKKTAAKRG